MRAQTTRRVLRGACLAAVALAWAATAQAQVGYTGSVYVLRIKTDEGERTDAVYFFNSLDVQAGRVRASMTLPLISLQSRWSDPDLGPVESGRQSGLADPMVRVDAEAWRSRRGDLSLRPSAAVKFPVAGVDDGFSSGEVDVAFGASFSMFRGRNSLLADVTYWALGDTPDAVYRDAPAFYVGYGRVLDRNYRWSGIVSVSGSRAVTSGVDPPAQVSVALLRILGSGAAFGLSLDVGLMDGASDIAIGSTWRFAF